MVFLIAFLACAPEYKDVPVKVVGVGYNPEEIGPSPTPYGGVVEYSWVNFSGGGLSLALMQLGSFDEVGPGMGGFAPPYAAVYGFSYLFTERLEAADSLGGVTSVPPDAEESCYTTYEASGPIGSFKTVDVGDYMELVTESGEGGLRLERNPAQYPADAQNAFAYYSTIDLWRDAPMYALVPEGDGRQPDSMQQVLVQRASFPSGESVAFRFPGGIPPQNAPLGSIPVPSGVAGTTTLKVPAQPGGVQLEWSGPRYDSRGAEAQAEGEHRTCLAFSGTAVADPQGPSECVSAVSAQATEGQIYTGPWDTSDGRVLFRWEPGDDPDEYVSLSVRFLGPVDRADPNFSTEMVYEEPTRSISASWNALTGTKIPEMDAPQGVRSPTACEEEGAYEFNTSYTDEAGDLIPSLRGDPFHNMAEVTCRLADDGEFALTNAIVADALTYARSHGSEGVVFYFGRSNDAEVEVPDAMDNYGNRKSITPIKVASRAIDIGRFWFEGN